MAGRKKNTQKFEEISGNTQKGVVKSKKSLKVRKVNKSRRKKGFSFKKEITKSFQNPLLASKDGENVCMVCGGETYDVHCKRICKNCGYMRDCSDP